MRQKSFCDSLGTTSACVMRSVSHCEQILSIKDEEEREEVDLRVLFSPEEETPGLPTQSSSMDSNVCAQTKPKLFLGDSWFGSVKTAANVARSGHHGIFIVKTAHSRSPKKFLEETMADMPGGTWIVLEGRAEKEGVDLVSLGYKYNCKKVLTFVFTKGAGKTSPGKPYQARFPDIYGNVCVRHVARPQVVSCFFEYSNKIDLHNQARQYEVALEKKWVTQDPYFRLYTSILGMTVVDAWRNFQAKDKGFWTVLEFCDVLAYQLVEEANKIEEESSRILRSGMVIISP